MPGLSEYEKSFIPTIKKFPESAQLGAKQSHPTIDILPQVHSSTREMVKPTNVDYKDRYKMKNPNRCSHLEKYKWKSGESGNPGGRGHNTVSIVESLKAHLRRNPEDIVKIIDALIKEGKIGNMVATKEILDRIDGKVVETHKMEVELPIKILFVPAKELLKEGEFKEIEDEV